MTRKFLVVLATLLLLPVAVALVFPVQTARIAIGLERSASGLEERAVTNNGTVWPYLEGGPDSAPTLLLVHGFGGEKDNWLRFSRYLTDRFRVIAPDLPGFGGNVRDKDLDYSTGEQAIRLAGFVDALDLGTVHVVGHSMGGHIAALFAHLSPEHVATLALVTNGGITSPVTSEFFERLDDGDNPLLPRTREEFQVMLAFASYEPPFIPWPVSNYVADVVIAEADFKAFVIEFLRDDPDSALEPVLPAIDVPIFVLWGRHDRVIDVSTVDVIRELRPDADIVILEDAGHLPILEQPAVSANRYAAFLDTARP